MSSPCPTSDELEAFSRGEGDPPTRQAIAAHLAQCQTCEAAFVRLAIHRSLSGQTSADSPRAAERRNAVELPLGLEDTHVSGEKSAPLLQPLRSISGVTRGEALDRYVILERLGSGGMGEVFAAWDPVLDRKVAVKVLRDDFEQSEVGEELKHRLFREAQALARLAHPNVVTVHDVGIAEDRVYLAMEFVEGETLKSWLSKKPPWQAVVDVFLAAGEGLVAAHDQGLTHRDFKPDNVLVSRDGRVRVMDFGLAHGQASRKEADPLKKRTITQPGAMLGTPAYMSPEAMHGRQTDFRSDEFSFCVSLYEALYGQRPFEGATPAALLLEIEDDRVRAPPRDTKVPRRLHQLLLKGLRRDPDERFQTLRALLVQLGRRRSTRNRRRLIVVGLVAVLISAGASAFAIHRSRTRCAGFEARLTHVWDPPLKQAIRASFEATGKPWATTAWKDVEARLDHYAAQWVSQRRAACEGGKSDQALAQEILCLSRRLTDLRATTELFSHADADVVERAAATASTLPPLEACEVTPPLPSASQTDEPLHAQLSTVRALLDAGKYQDAVDRASEIATRANAAGDHAAVAEARLAAAIARVRLGDPRAADALVEEAILSAEVAQDDELEARGWVERVGFSALNGPSPDADRWVRFARAALDRVHASTDLEASMANNLGVLAYFRGQYQAAIDAHQQALRLRRQLYGEKHLLVARSHSNLGIAYRKAGRLDDARAEYEQALGIEESVLDPSHPAVAETLNNLGNVLLAQSAPTAARRAIERALRIKESAFGPDSLTVGVTLTNLGALLIDLAEPDKAIEALERSVAIKERRAGPEALTVAISLTNLAQALRAQHRWKDSLAADQRALAIRQKKQGPPTDLAYNLSGLGAAKVGLGDRRGALGVLEKALSLRKDPSPDRGETEYWLARALPPKDKRVKKLLDAALSEIPESMPLHREVAEARAKVK